MRVSSPQGRFADAAVVDGQVFRAASAWGRHLFHHYAGGTVVAGPIVHIHLGCTARSGETRVPMPEPRGQVRMRIVGAEYGTDLRGPTACEVIDEAQLESILARLGPDPLRADADSAVAWSRISRSRRAIGALLMDQSVLAGVGNVYRSELLFRHGIDPYRPGRAVDRAEFDAAWADLVELMKVGVRRGRIIVVRPEHDHGAPAYGRGGRAPTCTGAPVSPAGCAGWRCAPRRWRGATCSGALAARAEGSEAVEPGEVVESAPVESAPVESAPSAPPASMPWSYPAAYPESKPVP